MAKVVKSSLTAADVHAIAERLDRLEEKPRQLSTREIINMLKPKVTALRAKGYSFDEIAAELTRNEVKITASSLKAYVGQKKTTRKLPAAKIAPSNQSTDKPASEQPTEK